MPLKSEDIRKLPPVLSVADSTRIRAALLEASVIYNRRAEKEILSGNPDPTLKNFYLKEARDLLELWDTLYEAEGNPLED